MVYRLKVTIRSGAYLGRNKVERVLEVPGIRTLEDLCISILNSVEFDFDHLYEFNIRGRRYEGQPYGGGTQIRTKLYSLKLKKGETFALWYDFGDDWIFSIYVEDVLNETGDGIHVLSRKGTVEQYPDYDESGGEEEEDFEEWGGNYFDLSGMDPDGIAAAAAEMENGSLFSRPEDSYDYTPPDALYEASFRYKKTKLWKKISGQEPFAIRFTDGTEGTVVIMGQAGDHCAVAVYPGENAFYSYFQIATEPSSHVWYLENERIMMQDCLQLVFDNKEYLFEKELEAAKSYAQRNKIRFSGKNAFPHFVRYFPARFPWHPQDEAEERLLLEAVEAATALSSVMGTKKPWELGFTEITPFTTQIPLMVREDDRWILSGMQALPKNKSRKPVRAVPAPDAGKLKQVKKRRAKGTLEARIIMVSSPILDKDGGAPFFSFLLMGVDREKRLVLPPHLVRDLQKEADLIADHLLEQMILMNWRPAEILAEDERTFAFLAPLAKGIGAKLSIEDELEVLDDVLDGFLKNMGGMPGAMDIEDDLYGEGMGDSTEEAMLILDAILGMPDSRARAMPMDLKEMVRDMLEMGFVPPETAARVKRKLKLR
ncbi:MAG: hypothetical protein Q4D81_10775 [Eubacteriales bacterium]|nr:hypothetical protein [Eubacteriales bacterium]